MESLCPLEVGGNGSVVSLIARLASNKSVEIGKASQLVTVAISSYLQPKLLVVSEHWTITDHDSHVSVLVNPQRRVVLRLSDVHAASTRSEGP